MNIRIIDCCRLKNTYCHLLINRIYFLLLQKKIIIMDLSKILSISGKPGLFKMIAQSKNGLVVESLIDGKRISAFSHEKISSLEEISIFTETEDLSIKDIFKMIFEKTEGKKTISPKSPNKELKDFFETAVPEYDKDRVYVSDIKKVLKWYNILLEKELLDFSEEDEDKDGEEKMENPDNEKEKESQDKKNEENK